MSQIIRLKPLEYAHVLDLTSNITHVEYGPNTLVLQTNERLAGGPFPHIVVPPGHYCTVKHPSSYYVQGEPIKLRHGYLDVRFHKEPFVLIPGEVLVGAPDYGTTSSTYRPAIKPLPVIAPNHAILLEALIDHHVEGVEMKAGERFQVEGPQTYLPTAEAEIKGFRQPHVIKSNESIRLRATQDFTDKSGRERVTGEEWRVTQEGAYLPEVYEEVVEEEEAFVLTEDIAVHLRATMNVNFMGKKRHPGEEWLVTSKEVEALIPPIGVEKMVAVKKAVLGTNQYCVVLNPVDSNGIPQLGKKEVRKGVTDFFLHPGESLERGIQSAYVLSDIEALVLLATEEFVDSSLKKSKRRPPGEKWMIKGPTDYIPPIEVQVVDKRTAIPLSKNEGVYVRNTETGHVRAVMGPQAFLLNEHEVLWEKQLTVLVETLLRQGGGAGSGDIRKIAYFDQSIDPAVLKGRDKTRVVSYRCPGSTACQVYNYQHKTARVIFGPDLVIVGPHENFNVLSLSAGKPKVADAMQSLALMLGPDFITDIMEVETSDHARLQIRLSFNNHFRFDKEDPASAAKLFSVPDFIGYACSQIGAKIRASVAHIPFDEFHKNSAQVVQHAVFAQSNGKPGKELVFESNNLIVTGVDVQNIEPSDAKMRSSLMQSVQMAIEIATNSIEASAGHEAQRIAQEARGKLERLKLVNEKEAEVQRTILLELRANTAAVESTGQAVAEAQAHAEKVKIECESEIEVVTLRSEALQIEYGAQIETQQKLREAELFYQKQQNELEVSKARSLADLEVFKFSKAVNTMGRETIKAIATAGPESQVKLLQALGLESVLFTDGNNPVNLFNTAQGLVAAPQ